MSLEEILWKEVGTRSDYEQEIGEKPLGEFVREIVGLDMNAAKEAFSAYLTDTNLDSRQIYFVNQIVEYIVHNGMLKDFSVLQEAPFTDQGSVVEIFKDITVWMGIKRVIDSINANAAAALKFFEPQDMKLITAVLFLLILVIGRDRKKKVKKNA